MALTTLTKIGNGITSFFQLNGSETSKSLINWLDHFNAKILNNSNQIQDLHTHVDSSNNKIVEIETKVDLIDQKVSDDPFLYYPLMRQGLGEHSLVNTRIPSIEWDGDCLYAVCDHRQTGDVPSNCGIGIRISKDNGITWTPPKLIMYIDNSPINGKSDCCIINTPQGLFVYALSLTQNINNVNAQGSIWMVKSTDQGGTWSAPVEITNISKEGFRMVLTCPSKGVYKDGFMYMPVQYWHEVSTNKKCVAGMVRSSDGLSWDLVAKVDDVTSESCIAFLSGTLWMISKNEAGSGRITYKLINGTFIKITDNSTNTTVVSTQGSLCSYEQSGDNMLPTTFLIRCQNMYNKNSRSNLVVSISVDGVYWKDVYAVRYLAGRGYSGVVTDGKYIHVHYEDDIGCVYKRFLLSNAINSPIQY